MDIVRTRPAVLPRKRIALVFGAVALVGLVVLLWKTSAAAASAPAVARSSVWTEHVRHGDLLRQVPVQGSLVPEQVRWLRHG